MGFQAALPYAASGHTSGRWLRDYADWGGGFLVLLFDGFHSRFPEPKAA